MLPEKETARITSPMHAIFGIASALPGTTAEIKGCAYAAPIG
jgi:hypothetical protein